MPPLPGNHRSVHITKGQERVIKKFPLLSKDFVVLEDKPYYGNENLALPDSTPLIQGTVDKASIESPRATINGDTMKGNIKKNTEPSSPLVKFNFPSPPPLPNNPSSELPDLKSAQNSDYDIPRSHRNLKTGSHLIDDEDSTNINSPQRFKVNNMVTGKSDVYTKVIFPKPSVNEPPPPPPPRANLPKQKDFETSNSKSISENIYDNPIPYRHNNTNIRMKTVSEKSDNRQKTDSSKRVQNIEKAPSNIAKEIMKPSSDQTVTRDANKGSSKASPAKNGTSSYGSGVPGIMNMESMACARCDDGFEPKAKIVNSNGELFHPKCFVCAQCFRPFPDGVFYEFEGRKYCEHDFHVLFAPCCGKCGEFIIGRVIKAMMSTWHPQCFTCEMCHKELADLGFIKNQGRALCHDCNAKVKAEGAGKYMCQKCHSVIDGEPLRFRGEVYHPYHYNCTACGNELTSTAREVRTRPGYTANDLNELYCLRCHDKMGIPICGACRRPIEERVVTALGKHWHVEHFVCAKCEKPFLGNRHYERKGLAYCETHYHQLFGNLCYVCNQVIQGDVFTALNKAWCVNHFACSSCDQKMTVKTKFYEVDLKPVCKKCYDRYPRELRLRLKKYHDNEAAREQGGPIAAK